MGDVMAVVALTAAAAIALARRTTLPPFAIATAAPIAGLGLFTLVGAVAMAVRGQIDVIPVVAATTAVAIIAAVPAGTPWAPRRWWAIPGGAVAAGGIGWIAHLLPVTRLTPDSLDYLAVADILLEPSSTASLRLFDLETRNLTTALGHTLGSLDERLFSPAVTPVVVGMGLGFFVWAVFRGLVRERGGNRTGPAVLGLTAVAFALASGRVVYDVFYVNSHGFIMVAFFAAVAAAYLGRRESEPAWLVLAGMACPLVMVGRPEGPILVLIALAPSLADREVPGAFRLAAALPSSLTGLVWFGAVVAADYSELIEISVLDPTLGGVAISLALLVLGLVPAPGPFAGVVRWAPWLVVAALVSLAGVGFSRDRAMLEATVEATAVNLVGPGGWGVAWPVLVALLVAAVMGPAIEHERLLLAPVLGVLALVVASPVLRDAPYRVGTGDSGNRMLAHVVLAAIFYVVMSLAESGERSPGPIERIT